MANNRPPPLPRTHPVNEVDSTGENKASFAAELFPAFPRDFVDNIGLFLPGKVYQSYFAAIADELWVFDQEHHIISNVGEFFVVFAVVRANWGEPKADVIDVLVAAFAVQNTEESRKKIAASIEFVVKLWFLADFQSYNDRLGDTTSRPWPLNESLQEHVRTTIRDENEDPLDLYPGRRFSHRFTLYDMDWLCLIKIRWTNNIAQHLYLEEWHDRKFNRTVYIFSHTALMESIVQDPTLPGTGAPGGIQELLLETMDTLDLLMDLRDPEARAWYRKLRRRDNKQRKKLGLPIEAMDIYAGTPRREGTLLSRNMSELRRVGHYRHWQHRLLKLEKAFEESTPTTFMGWWRDKRNTTYWATFLSATLAILVAVVAVLFAVASIVTGPMSVDLAKKANYFAKEANHMAQEDSAAGSGSSPFTKTVETQPVIIVVQGCCGCTACESPEVDATETLTMTRTTAQVVSDTGTTCTASIGN